MGDEPGFRVPLVRTGRTEVKHSGRRGFGSRLLERIVAAYFDGTATVTFEPHGLVYKLSGRQNQPSERVEGRRRARASLEPAPGFALVWQGPRLSGISTVTASLIRDIASQTKGTQPLGLRPPFIGLNGKQLVDDFLGLVDIA